MAQALEAQLGFLEDCDAGGEPRPLRVAAPGGNGDGGEDADDGHHQQEFDQGEACVPTGSGHGVALREQWPITRQVCPGWLFHRLNLVGRHGSGDGRPTGGAFAAFSGAPR